MNYITIYSTLIECSTVQKDEEVESFRLKFAGSQADRLVKAEADQSKVAEQLKNTKITGANLYDIKDSAICYYINLERLIEVHCSWDKAVAYSGDDIKF